MSPSLYFNQEWNQTHPSVNSGTPVVVALKCPNCAAPLTNDSKCDYCGVRVVVDRKEELQTRQTLWVGSMGAVIGGGYQMDLLRASRLQRALRMFPGGPPR